MCLCVDRRVACVRCGCSLFVVCWLRCVVWCVLGVGCGLLCVVCGLMCGSSFVVRCALFVARRCVPFGGC